MVAPHLLSPQSISDKSALRAKALAARTVTEPALGMCLAGQVLMHAAPPPYAAVAGFWPMGSEIDIRALLLALIGRGHLVLLPETPARGQPLRFRVWRPGTPMIPERFGTARPDSPVHEPDVLLVPLLAFDARCRRLGYGGGYYDRTIAAHPGIRTIGCAYASQQVDAVPVLPHDALLDVVATERGVFVRPES